MNRDNFIGKKVLLNTEWFIAPDGQNYRAIWGTLKSISKVDELIGFAPNRPNANWVYEIGDIVINGCQVKLIILCDKEPDAAETLQWEKAEKYYTPSAILKTS